MTSVLQQLNRWRLCERVIRLAWGLGRWFAIVATVLAVACLADWLIDRYAGSQTWATCASRRGCLPRPIRSRLAKRRSGGSASRSPPLNWRWRQSSATCCSSARGCGHRPIDDFAVEAEKEYRAFDHRLVTAIQLNRLAR